MPVMFCMVAQAEEMVHLHAPVPLDATLAQTNFDLRPVADMHGMRKSSGQALGLPRDKRCLQII